MFIWRETERNGGGGDVGRLLRALLASNGREIVREKPDQIRETQVFAINSNHISSLQKAA